MSDSLHGSVSLAQITSNKGLIRDKFFDTKTEVCNTWKDAVVLRWWGLRAPQLVKRPVQPSLPVLYSIHSQSHPSKATFADRCFPRPVNIKHSSEPPFKPSESWMITLLNAFGRKKSLVEKDPYLGFFKRTIRKCFGHLQMFSHQVISSTLTCRIVTARCLLGRVFSLAACDKSNSSISNLSTGACKDNWPEHL